MISADNEDKDRDGAEVGIVARDKVPVVTDGFSSDEYVISHQLP